MAKANDTQPEGASQMVWRAQTNNPDFNGEILRVQFTKGMALVDEETGKLLTASFGHLVKVDHVALSAAIQHSEYDEGLPRGPVPDMRPAYLQTAHG